MHRVAAPSTTMSRGSLLLLSQLFTNHSIYMVGHTALGAQQRVTWSLHLPHMMGRDLLFQVWCIQMTQSTLNLWWVLNLVIPVWWLGIRLISVLTPGLQSSLLPTPTFILGSLVRCHHYPTFHWNQGMRIMPLWVRLLLTLDKALTPSSLIHLRQQNRKLPWMSLMSLHLQSFLGFSAWSLPFLTILSCSLLLAFELVNCGARLGHFLPLHLCLPRCQHLNWFATFLATLQPLDSGPLLHQITSPWILPRGNLISLSLIFRLVLVLLHMLLLTQSNSSLASRLLLLILFPHCPRLGGCYTCVWSAWITFQDSWHFGQDRFQVSWKVSSDFSISI